jgi:NTP pyrophosphatase (non-canonical NTP hydrolase)
MAKQESALVTVATELDAELETYTRLGELFLRSPVDTVKHLERAKSTLDELAQSEARLQQAAQRLVAAIVEARGKQEELGKRVVEHAPQLKTRNDKLQELVAAMHGIAARVGEITKGVSERDPKQVADETTSLSAQSEQLAQLAREAGFVELADQAHALHQRLRDIAAKLQGAR